MDAERSAGRAVTCRRSSAAASWLVAQFPAPLQGAAEPQRTSTDPLSAPADSCLLDVADLSMEALDRVLEAHPDTVLGAMLRRVADEAVEPVGVPYSAFDSSI
ncbi:FxSxx-COOH cyclophane-containing RiPP peptide [Streptomyces sp. NPDC050508]|uniref:FxSxx-COOH cyclophane-containing RiPP peptide n=1 Tax=Streptomyces sp. NPDC050508 TaxID=3155405 RepID=UPI003413BA7D